MSAPRRFRVSMLVGVLGFLVAAGVAGTGIASERLSCEDFRHQEEAQAILNADRSDPYRLDGGDGVACRSLPHRNAVHRARADEDLPATTPLTPTTPPAPAPPPVAVAE